MRHDGDGNEVNTYLENHIMNSHWCLQFGSLKHQLEAKLSFAALRRIPLIIIDSGLDNPLQIEGRKSGRFIEQLVNIFVRSERTELEVVEGNFLER